MDWWLQTMAVVGMFMLRLGVPLAITVVVGYMLRRLDTKWQAEAMARQADVAVAKTEASQAEPALAMFKVIDQPCWIFKDCPEPSYKQCPAYEYPDLPCWMARLRTEGRLPSPCHRCGLFNAGKVVRQTQLMR